MTMRTNDNGADRDMIETEIAGYMEWQKIAQAEAQAQADAQTARAVAREALLTRLGITADEAQLLLGS